MSPLQPGRFLIVVASALSVSLCACAGGSATTSPPDMSMLVPPALTVQPIKDTNAPADEACIANPMNPAPPTMPTVVTGRIVDFQDSSPISGAIVKVYFTVADAKADKPVAVSMPSDADGNYTMTIPPGHARIIRSNSGGVAISAGNKAKTIPTIEFNMKYDDKAPTGVKESTRDAISGLVSIEQAAGQGVLAGAVRDCQNKETAGAIVSVGVKGTSFTGEGSIFYFKSAAGSGVPVRGQKWTTDLGVFAVLNVPPGTATVTASGITMTGGALQKLSSFQVPVIADAITIIDMPTGSPPLPEM